MILSIVVSGCSLCAHGHLDFLVGLFASICFPAGCYLFWDPKLLLKDTEGYWGILYLREFFEGFLQKVSWPCPRKGRSTSFGRAFCCRSLRKWLSAPKTSLVRWWCPVQAAFAIYHGHSSHTTCCNITHHGDFCFETRRSESRLGPGMKLDVLTFVMFQAPCSLLPLLISLGFSWEHDIWVAFQAKNRLFGGWNSCESCRNDLLKKCWNLEKHEKW